VATLFLERVATLSTGREFEGMEDELDRVEGWFDRRLAGSGLQLFGGHGFASWESRFAA
jgi:hypothetical protein